MNPYSEKVAVLTGAASGIGRALSEELGRRGAIVVVTDLDEAGARRVAEGIVAAGGRASSAALDVRDASAVRRIMSEAAASHGRLDYLFNNAGFAVVSEIRDVDPESWRRIVEVNLLGVIHGVSAGYPLMVRQGFGHIVNTASLAGLAGLPGATAYATTKYGIVGLSLGLRAEARRYNVRVSVVCPAFIRTNIFDASTYLQSHKEDSLRTVRFKMLEPDDAARRILRGVERDRSVIVFPFYARLLCWLTRLHPALGEAIHRTILRDFRSRNLGVAKS
jgi:NAD(P)-dependent dehydrogenase (short-subunit alcohol dehydrogenase family)